MARSLAALSALALGMLIAACGADEPATEATPTPTATAAPTAPKSDDAEAIAEIQAVYRAYWDAMVAAESGPSADPALFEGIATVPVIELNMRIVQGFIQNGIHREGAPDVAEPSVSVDGDTARIEGCVDLTESKLMAGDTEVGIQHTGPEPRVYDAERSGDAWLISAEVDQAEATITC